MSILDFVNMASTLSVSTIKTQTLVDGTGVTYASLGSTSMYFYAAAFKGITVTATGGSLHGAWSSEATITTSDRRLKRNIEPLYRTIASRARDRWADQPAAGNSALGLERTGEKPIAWLLRELRPVSFHLKRGPEAKYLKFGFIAQELETVFPNLVRTIGEDETKAVASQDLIAVLTLAIQNLQKELEDYRAELALQRERMERLERAVLAMQQP